MLFHVILSSHTVHHFLSFSTPSLPLLSYPSTSPSYFVIFTYFLTLSAFSFFFFSHIFIFSPSSFPQILLSFPRLYLYLLASLLSFFLLSSDLRSFPRHACYPVSFSSLYILPAFSCHLILQLSSSSSFLSHCLWSEILAL
jgi:hypothetical protein